MVGLHAEDMVETAMTARCGELYHCVIASPFSPGTDFTKSFSNISGLEEKLRELLTVLLRNRYPSVFTVHHGLIHYFGPPGTYTASSLMKQKGGYERLFPDSLNFELINQLPCLKKLVRYDFFIETNDNMTLNYQVYLKDGTFVRDITEVQPYLARSVVPGSPGPGFLLNRTANLCRFDVIDPQRNITTRLKLNYIDESFISTLKVHADVLAESFFKKIELIEDEADGKVQLNVQKLPLPQGYELTYYRCSLRNEYTFGENFVGVSKEKVYHDAQKFGTISKERDIVDVFMYNHSLEEIFHSPDWNVDAALEAIEGQLKFQDEIMNMLN